MRERASWSHGHTPPRWVRWTLVGVATFLLAATFAVTTARADLSLGPHEAEYAMRADGLVVVDLGPLGTLQIDSPLPLNLGVRVTVEEIPADVSTLGQSETLEALGNDLTAYMQFFSGPEAAITEVASALVRDALLRLVSFLLVAVALGLAGYLVLGPVRRRELAELLAPRTVPITAGCLIVVLVAATATSADRQTEGPLAHTATAVFDGTPLEGARVTGRLSGIIDTYGGMLVTAYRDNEAYYDRVTENVTVAWQEREALTAAQDALLPAALRSDERFARRLVAEPAESPDALETTGDLGEDADLAGAPDDDEPQGEEATAEADEDESEVVTMLVISDLHCNTGMTPVIHRVAELSGADVVLNAGDTTMNGSSVERFCVTSFARATPDGVPTIVSNGNHDSAVTAEQMSAAGMTMLDGQVIEVAGVRILGDSDPAETRVGTGTAVGSETAGEMGARLAEVACADEDGVDLLLIHTPRVGDEAMASGCVPAQVSGHLHTRIGPVAVERGVRYVNGSTAGAASGQLTVGPLHGTAQLTVLRFDVASRTMLDYRLVTVVPSGQAEVGAAVRFPRPLPEEPAALPVAPGGPEIS